MSRHLQLTNILHHLLLSFGPIPTANVSATIELNLTN